MVEQQFKIAEIEVAKSPTDEKILGIFRFEGTTQKKKGTKILILAELHSTLYAYERLLDVINETVDQTRLLIIDVEQDPVARFEKLIQRLNEAVQKFLQGEPTPISWNRVNIFILELSQNHVCLTGRGRLMNVFLQKQEDGGYRTFDLFGSLEQPVDVDPKKPFASLICGDIKEGDVLIAGSTNLERLRNELRIKERLTSMPPVSAALEIKQDLDKRGIPDDFIAAVVACCELEKPSIIPPEEENEPVENSTNSINRLRKTEQEAEQRLSPTLSPATPSGDKTEKAMHIVSGVLGYAFQAIKRLTKFKYQDVAQLSSLRGMSAGHGSMFNKKRKRTLMIVGATLIIIIAVVGIWKRNQRLAVEASAWTATYEQASDSRNKAESDLVYGNDIRAKKEIDEAVGLLAGLDLNKEENKDKVDGLNNELNKLRERLQKISAVDPVNVLTALDGVSAGTMAAPVLIGNTAYVVDNSTRTILKTDLESKDVKKIALPEDAEQVVAGSAGNNSVIFITASSKMFALNKLNDTVSAISYQSQTETTNDLVVYANRAYALDGSNGQVWRAEGSGSGFGTAQGYIKASDVSLTGSVGMAIDGSVYVIKPDGNVTRFLSGGQEGFNLTDIDPPLRAASAIWTEANIDRIVITDPADKRILIFNKDGSLRAQLTSDQFSGPRDVASDEEGKNLLVVDGTRLILIPMP
ncbi:MAG: hypothetical protein ABII13_02630 [Patescibacteria group bacterium]|nr:hypothetical protein [Patescibacteria group bacterium]MBU2508878.1 hypothetical protein [Patescibacteria group bacterium]